MAKFLNTSATTYFLEELIKDASERLVLISPYLKFSDRIKELLEDKDRLKIDIRIVYGKSELQPSEINWLKSLKYVRTSFCKNLHAKCYLNENICIVTSLNLYEFSQVNNNEMGVLLSRDDDIVTYREAYEEAQRIVRVSDEVRVEIQIESEDNSAGDVVNDSADVSVKISSSKFAKKHKLKTKELLDKFVVKGYLEKIEAGHTLTKSGISIGAELRSSKRFGDYFVWPKNLQLD